MQRIANQIPALGSRAWLAAPAQNSYLIHAFMTNAWARLSFACPHLPRRIFTYEGDLLGAHSSSE